MNKKEKFIKIILLACASLSAIAVVAITVSIVAAGWRIFTEYGVVKFLFGTQWSPDSDIIKLGILKMIVGTGAVTICALIIGGPIAVLSAIYLAEISPKRLATIFQCFVDLLAGIPSVIYGFWGLVVLVPAIRKYLGSQQGYSVLAGGIVLAIMILPTVVRISTDALRAVPKEFRDGSYALGADKWYTIFKVVMPAASPGIITALILGFGRAIGETMAVLMVTGNAKVFPTSLLEPVRTITGNIALEIGYSWGLHRQALFACGAVLMMIIIFVNIVINKIMKKVAGVYYE
ncbi:phosphate ABC transporter permease subunit PstC [Clostridium sp. 'deep sea']|uniref:phosphate ABC transporter permease subunit PstC n=1 Tax=Clostridium sp. 'deep sea' TaxID=2779445 RepID=UPI001896791F|nr:phosphate ABC transporter permease subunit PstC [Clostridium sp. 'deep sea']QOR35750.1 phosphate ABC transporter permease subunit PstC [Clostridium sp. 'deep sea']